MKFAALISGGKDSCFSLMHAVANGHELIAIANLHPPASSQKDEMDSYMFQTVGHSVIKHYSELLGVPLYQRELERTSSSLGKNYTRDDQDEVEDLYLLLESIKLSMPELEAICCGAILSSYQRVRVENVCNRLGLVSLAYLWESDQPTLLDQMCEFDLNAILIKVCSIGLKESHLGQSLVQMRPLLLQLNERYDVHVCGEGGEYETLTLDCPLFKKSLQILESKVVKHSDDAYAPVSYLQILSARTVVKDVVEIEWKNRLLENTIRKLEKCDYVDTPLFDTVISYERSSSKRESNSDFAVSKYWSSPVLSLSIKPRAQFENIMISETRTLFNIIRQELEAHGLTTNDIFILNAYVKDMSLFQNFNSVYQEYFGHEPTPRVTVQVGIDSNVMIDLMACAEIQTNGFTKESIHVQGISYWAPANIGPYSQTCQINDLIFIAGMIGLIPHQMNLPSASSVVERFQREVEYAFDNANQVSKRIGGSLKDVAISCICFTTSRRYIATIRAYLSKMGISNGAILVLVVDRLPKDALVEFHFVCASQRGYASILEVYDNNDREIEVNELGNERQYIRRELNFCNGFGWVESNAFGFSNSVIAGAGITGSTLTDDLLSVLVEELIDKHVLAQSKFNVVTLKVYYLDVIGYEQIHTIVSQALEKRKLTCALVLVPVCAIESDAILSIYTVGSQWSKI